jgi:hypothetical protein
MAGLIGLCTMGMASSMFPRPWQLIRMATRSPAFRNIGCTKQLKVTAVRAWRSFGV